MAPTFPRGLPSALMPVPATEKARPEAAVRRYREFSGRIVRVREADAPADAPPEYELSFSSEEPALREDWWTGEKFFEVLSHDQVDVNLDRFNAGIAGVFVNGHGGRGGEQVGVVRKGWIDEKERKGRARIRLSRRQLGKDVALDVEDEVLVGASVGYDPGDFVLEKEEGGVPTYRYKWEAVEITLTGIPLDATVGFGREAAGPRTQGPGLVRPAKEGAMPEPTVDLTAVGKEGAGAGGAPATREGGAAVVKESREDELKRIAKLAEQHRRPDVLVKALAEGLSYDAVRELILGGYAGRATAGPSAEAIVDASAKDRRAYRYTNALRMACAMHQRSNGEFGGVDEKSLEFQFHEEIRRKLPPGVKYNGGLMLPSRLFDGNVEEEMERDRAARRGRAMGAWVGSGGAELVQAQYGELIDILRARLAFRRLGATFLPGLTTPMEWPEQLTDATSYWRDENPPADVASSELTFATKMLSPKSLSASVPLPRQLVLLSSLDVEALVRSSLGAVDARAIERAGFHGLGTDAQPLGLYNAPGIQAFAMGGDPTYAKLVDMTGAVADKDADFGTLGWVFTPIMAARMKRTVVVSGQAIFVWAGDYEEGEVAGFRATTTNLVSKTLGAGAEHGLAFGNWATCIIGQFGAFEVIADVLTLKKKGQIELTTFNMADVLFQRGPSMVIATGATLPA